MPHSREKKTRTLLLSKLVDTEQNDSLLQNVFIILFVQRLMVLNLVFYVIFNNAIKNMILAKRQNFLVWRKIQQNVSVQ